MDFAQDLLQHDKELEALALLPRLGQNSLSLLIRFRVGKINASEATAAARAILTKGGNGDDHWALAVLARAAEQQQDTQTRTEALEMLLATEDESRNLAEAAPTALWQSYFSLALVVGNQHQLLQGDDTAWFALAEQMELENPIVTRALFAHLSRKGQDASLRHDAEIQLALNLLRARLVRVANAILPDSPDLSSTLAEELDQANVAAMPRETWLALGRLAHLRGEFERAAEYSLYAANSAPDELARQARQLAAENLTRAGFFDDANKQYEILGIDEATSLHWSPQP